MNWLRLAALSLVIGMLWAQGQSQQQMPECGLGLDKGHPCQCVRHTQTVQAAFLAQCTAEKLKDPKQKMREIAKDCAAHLQTHCSIVEHYGNWGETDAQGFHTHPMPQQCTRACTRSHCACDDGPKCHFAHSAADDQPARGKK